MGKLIFGYQSWHMGLVVFGLYVMTLSQISSRLAFTLRQLAHIIIFIDSVLACDLVLVCWDIVLVADLELYEQRSCKS